MLNKRLIAEIINGEEIVMTIDQNMLSCEFGALDRGNITDVTNWGIYANRGSISFIDNIGYFNNVNIHNPVVLSYEVKIYVCNSSRSNIIATFNIDDIKLREETREVNIELISKILSLEKEKTTGSIYTFYPCLVTQLLGKINEKCKYSKFYLGADPDNILYTKIGCPYIGVDTVWNVITKICQATMSRVVETPQGKFEITSSFPQKNPIVIKPNNIISIESAGFVKVKNAKIDVTERNVCENMLLDGASKNFYIKRDYDGNCSGADGFNVTNIRRTEDAQYGIYEEFLNGTLEVTTPYKIFSISGDKSDVERRIRISKFFDDDYILIDSKNTTSWMVMCSNLKIINETDIGANVDEFQVTYRQTEPNSHITETLIDGGKFKFLVSTFVDKGKKTISIDSDDDGELIESNDLIQTISKREVGNANYDLGEYILDEVKHRYSKGVECFEVECLFNDYYDKDGVKVFDKEDIVNRFVKYDLVIPYVQKNGETVPLRENNYGTPKKFRVIGISYLYDGLLRQKLQLQEERYDLD